MGEKGSIRYFLGANSARGFYSLYDDFVHPEQGDFLWVIKGGPGCGKSTFMRKIGQAAENAGMTVEYILCSGDPASLDGVYIKECRTAYVDGTAPHTMDCVLPGGGGLYLDLGSFYRPEPLIKRRDELSRLFAAYKSQYARAYRLLAAAEAVAPSSIPGLLADMADSRVEKWAAALAHSCIPKGEEYRAQRRFLSAITCEGYCRLYESVESHFSRVITVDDCFGLADSFFRHIHRICGEKNQPVILCPDPLSPEKLEAVLLPQEELAIVAVTCDRPWPGKVWRHLRLDAVADAQTMRHHREVYDRARNLQNELMESAYQTLREAKTLHDELEAVYNPWVDFDAQNELCQLHMDYLLGRME